MERQSTFKRAHAIYCNWTGLISVVYIVVFIGLLVGSQISKSPWRKNMFMASMAMLTLIVVLAVVGALLMIGRHIADCINTKYRKNPSYKAVPINSNP